MLTDSGIEYYIYHAYERQYSGFDILGSWREWNTINDCVWN